MLKRQHGRANYNICEHGVQLAGASRSPEREIRNTPGVFASSKRLLMQDGPGTEPELETGTVFPGTERGAGNGSGILFREYCFGGENSLSSAANSR